MSVTILRNVTWETYECLLKNYENSSSPRIAYDRGTIEIMSPLIPHEKTNRALATLVERVAEEWGIPVLNLGSTTFKREDVARGVEPDTCFYIQNLAQVEQLEEIDLEGGDPPPDLIIEVDVTSHSLNKLPIFLGLGVTEVWRVVDDSIIILCLEAGEYVEQETSHVLPPLTRTALNGLLAQSKVLRNLSWYQTIRQWASENQGR